MPGSSAGFSDNLPPEVQDNGGILAAGPGHGNAGEAAAREKRFEKTARGRELIVQARHGNGMMPAVSRVKRIQ